MPAENEIKFKSYLSHQAGKLSMEDIGARLASAFDDLEESLAAVTPRQMFFKPGNSEWSIARTVGHVLTANAQTCSTVEALIANMLPDNIKSLDDPPAESVFTLVVQARERIIGIMRRLPEDTPLTTTAPYSSLGPLNCKEWLILHRIHVIEHVQQILSVKASPEFPKG